MNAASYFLFDGLGRRAAASVIMAKHAMHNEEGSHRPFRASARDEAAAWHARLDSESATEQDWLAFEQWLHDRNNKAAYDALDRALVDVAVNRDAIAAAAEQAPTPPAIWRPVWIAAAVAMAAAALFALYPRPAPVQEFAYATPAASDLTVTLPDATAIHLNRNTALRVKFGRDARQIILDRGEASFQVSHNPARPFSVAIDTAIVRDVGTEFNVARQGRNFVVTVRRGEVELTAAATPPRLLHEGVQAHVSESGVRVEPVNVDDAFAWQSGRLVYHDAPLSAIIDDLSRYSAHPIVLDPDVRGLRFSGVLAIEDGSVMLRRLQAFLPIQSAQDGDRIVLRSRR